MLKLFNTIEEQRIFTRKLNQKFSYSCIPFHEVMAECCIEGYSLGIVLSVLGNSLFATKKQASESLDMFIATAMQTSTMRQTHFVRSRIKKNMFSITKKTVLQQTAWVITPKEEFFSNIIYRIACGNLKGKSGKSGIFYDSLHGFEYYVSDDRMVRIIIDSY